MRNKSRTHPGVSFLYFFAAIGFSMVFIHPLCLGISLFGSSAQLAALGGKKALKTSLFYMLPVFLLSAALNPMFNHEGITILCYLPGGNPLTLESIFQGLGAAAMMAAVICRFACFNIVMTGDKLIYVFGRLAPSLSLMLSMTLRFVPRFKEQIREISDAQRAIGKNPFEGNMIKRLKLCIKILSAQITQSLECAVVTADSMKSRGFGTAKRTAYSNYDFEKKDAVCLSAVLLLSALVLWGAAEGKMSFRWFPSVRAAEPSALGTLSFAAYFLLCFCPLMLEIKEVFDWKRIK